MIQYISLQNYPPALSVTHSRRIERAIHLALTSDMRQKHGAILYQSGRVISVGVNILRNAPKVHVPYDAISTHAEINCLGGVAKKTGVLYIARVSSGGNVANSEPCPACRNYLEKFTQIKKVYHT